MSSIKAGTGIKVVTIGDTSTISNTGLLSLKHDSLVGIEGDIKFTTPDPFGIAIDDTSTPNTIAFTNTGVTTLSSSAYTVHGDAILTGGTGIDITGVAQTLTLANLGVAGIQAEGAVAQTDILNFVAGTNVTLTESSVASVPTFTFATSEGSGPQMITSLTPGTFTVPYTLAYLNFILSGGGGGGSEGAAIKVVGPSAAVGGAGGGSGTIVTGTILCSKSEVFAYSIGGGGAWGAAGSMSVLQHGPIQPGGAPLLDSYVHAPGGQPGQSPVNPGSGLLGGRGGAGGAAGTPGFKSVSYGGGGSGPLGTGTAGGASVGSLSLEGTAGLPINDVGLSYGGSGGMCPLPAVQCQDNVNPYLYLAAGGNGGGSRGGLGSNSAGSTGYVGAYGCGGGGGCGVGLDAGQSTIGGSGGSGYLIYWYTALVP